MCHSNPHIAYLLGYTDDRVYRDSIIILSNRKIDFITRYTGMTHQEITALIKKYKSHNNLYLSGRLDREFAHIFEHMKKEHTPAK